MVLFSRVRSVASWTRNCWLVERFAGALQNAHSAALARFGEGLNGSVVYGPVCDGLASSLLVQDSARVECGETGASACEDERERERYGKSIHGVTPVQPLSDQPGQDSAASMVCAWAQQEGPARLYAHETRLFWIASLHMEMQWLASGWMHLMSARFWQPPRQEAVMTEGGSMTGGMFRMHA